ncbi:MAG: hypothetical protein WC730_02925 [Patescibacteria group bacterium]|jgi:hypothetical protein
METDYSEIKLNHLFVPVKKIFEFFILGIGFVSQKDFQKAFLLVHPGLAPLVNTYNQEVNLQIEGCSVTSETKLYWINIGRLMAIAIFDILQCSEYHNAVKNTEIFKFAKHIRNGAAHDNKFDLNPPIKKSITWRQYTIDQSLNNQTVFPDFISSATLIHLMADISVVIEKNEKRKIGATAHNTE